MERPNVKQWVVLWCGAIWIVGSLLIAGDSVVRSLIAGCVITALLFLQLGGKRGDSQQSRRAALSGLPPTSDANLEAVKPPLADAVPAVESNPAGAIAPTAQQTPGPSGVGGWLVPLVIGMLLTPILNIYLLSLYGEIWTDRWFFTLTIAGGIFSGWSLFVALALLNRWPSAPKLAQAQLVSSLIFGTGIAVLAVVSAGVDISESAPTLIGSFLGTLLWVSYFNKSRRVAATYGPMPPGPIRMGHANVMGLAAGVLVCLISLAVAHSRRQVWAEFHSESGHYEVEAPGQARASTLENGITQEAFGNDVRGFVISNATLTPENADAQSYFRNVRNAVVAKLKGTIIRTSSVDLNGYPGNEFVATFPGNGVTGDLRGRIYKTDSEGFLLLVSGPQGGRTESDADRFFRSFRIEP
jgi:hypothetical protein